MIVGAEPKSLRADLDRSIEALRAQATMPLDLDYILELAKTIGWDEGFEAGRDREQRETAQLRQETVRARRDEQRLRTVLRAMNRAHEKALRRLRITSDRLSVIRRAAESPLKPRLSIPPAPINAAPGL